jgi:hypothetical protein
VILNRLVMDTDEPNDDLLPLLLGICEDFFTGAGPAIHREVDALLQGRRITGGPGWLIDMLALTRQRLETPVDPADQASGRRLTRMRVTLELTDIDHAGWPELALKLAYKRLRFSRTQSRHIGAFTHSAGCRCL